MAGGDFIAKTRSEQRLEWLFQQQKHRKLTNDEWQDVRRCEHAIYCRIRRQAIAEAKAEEEKLAAQDRGEVAPLLEMVA